MYKTVTKWFLWSVVFRNWPSKFPIPIILNLTGCRKCIIFCGKCLEISQKLHGGDKKHIEVCKKKKNQLKINRWAIFHPYANFNCRVSQNRLVRLDPVLLECITFSTPWIDNVTPLNNFIDHTASYCMQSTYLVWSLNRMIVHLGLNLYQLTDTRFVTTRLPSWANTMCTGLLRPFAMQERCFPSLVYWWMLQSPP